MLQYLFFCCSTKQKDHTHTVSLEDVNGNNPLITKNSSSINCITQSHNNALSTETNNNNIKIPDEKENNNKENKDNNEINEISENDNIISQNNKNDNINNNINEEKEDENSPVFNNPIPKTQFLTINNINNININIHSEEKLKNAIKIDENEIKKEIMKSTEEIPRLKKLNTQGKENNISGENSKEILQQNKSFISFSNITIKYNNNGADSSLNLSDTEILSSCELTLMGELFFNKEIKIDRSCIRNNGVLKNRNKKSYEIKFGLASNVSEMKNNTNNNEETLAKSGNKNSNMKISKLSSIKTKQNKKKIQSLSSFSSLGNNALSNKNQIDVLLDLPFNKIQKKLNESNNNQNNNSNNNGNTNTNNNEYITLFLLKYDLNMDVFQLISMHDCVPVQLLLNYNFPLKFQQNYNILVGGVKMKLRITKNEKNESIINIYICNNNNEKKKSLRNYTFNPTKDKMPITIGRNICNINLDNISVSKIHAQIDYIFEYDEFFITDCNSTNGTYLLMQNSSNAIYIKQDLIFRLCESNFRIYYTNFQKLGYC